jgi:hypothetical protein
MSVKELSIWHFLFLLSSKLFTSFSGTGGTWQQRNRKQRRAKVMVQRFIQKT